MQKAPIGAWNNFDTAIVRCRFHLDSIFEAFLLEERMMHGTADRRANNPGSDDVGPSRMDSNRPAFVHLSPCGRQIVNYDRYGSNIW